MSGKDSLMKRQKELTELLEPAARAYYAEDREIMSNYEYDQYYDELLKLEAQTGVVLAGSPTTMVGYEAVEELPKERHERAMLSLGKTKSREELEDWLHDQTAILSWKLDGLTVVLTYQEGKLVKAVTRGNGEIGEVVTNNVKVFRNVPLTIPYQGELILRGEAVITYSDFAKINEQIEDIAAKYKNPRNLCSGSVRQLNNEITAGRNVRFFAFALVRSGPEPEFQTRMQQLLFLQEQGFSTVDYELVTKENIQDIIDRFEKKAGEYDIPSDGLVLLYDDIAYGESLGATSKFPRDSMAFKWMDETRETILTELEWSASRTGLINPVAIFEPVELEGTTVSRASVHNISILKNLELGIGDHITVYKANMIIPQIAENLTRSGNLTIPDQCPVCNGATQIQDSGEVQSLYCTNPECGAKKIKSFTLFVSRDAMNIEGLSEATLEKFIEKGFIKEYADLFKLERYEEEIVNMEGFGEKSYKNLMESIEASRAVSLSRLIYSLGIPNIGVANAKMICRRLGNRLERLMNVSEEELSRIDGVGEVIARSFVEFFADAGKKQQLAALLELVSLEQEETGQEEQTLAGKTFVVTGSLNHFESRNELKELIEEKGGKVAGSVSAKTVCLINNDNTSTSSKNKKARELQIPILTEDEFMKQYLEGDHYAD